MDTKTILEAIKRVMEVLETPEEKELDFLLDELADAKFDNPAEYQTALDNIQQCIDYHLQSAERDSD